MRALVAPGDRLFLSPSLAREATQRKLKQPFRTWCLLRALDNKGMGFFDMNTAFEVLRSLGWERRTLYRHLDKGEGVFWRRETYHDGTRTGLRLMGALKLADAWGIERLSAYQVEIPLDLVAPPSARQGRVARWNAVLFVVGLPRPRPGRARIHKNGQIRQLKALPNHPYSRAKLRKDTGIPERSQRRYDRLRDNGGRLYVSRGRPNYQVMKSTVPHSCSDRMVMYLPKLERNLVRVTGKSAEYWIRPRLGNSFESRLQRHGWGQAKAYNRCARVQRHLLHKQGASCNRRGMRRFFDTEETLAKAIARGRPVLADDVSFLLPVRERGRPWVREWATIENWLCVPFLAALVP